MYFEVIQQTCYMNEYPGGRLMWPNSYSALDILSVYFYMQFSSLAFLKKHSISTLKMKIV